MLSHKEMRILSDARLNKIIEQALEEGPITIKCQSWNEAVSLHSKLLKYIKAQEDLHNPAMTRPDSPLYGIPSIYSTLVPSHNGLYVIINKGNQFEVGKLQPAPDTK